MDFEAIRDEFLGIETDLLNLREMLREEVSNALTGIPEEHARMSWRIKEVDSYLTKVLRKGYEHPLSNVVDKVGVRAELLYTSERSEVVERLAKSTRFKVIKLDDKVQLLGDDRLGYVGVNLDVMPVKIIKGYPPEVSICEIQVRTFGEGMWAAASHDLIYKSSLDPGTDTRRRINRLIALVELFDDEVERARAVVMKLASEPLGAVTNALEDLFRNFHPVHYDRQLTRAVISVLVDGLGDDEIKELIAELERRVNDDREHLSELFLRYRDDPRGALLRQPEALLVYHLLEAQRHSLADRWRDDLPYDFLESLAAIFGKSLPQAG